MCWVANFRNEAAPTTASGMTCLRLLQAVSKDGQVVVKVYGGQVGGPSARQSSSGVFVDDVGEDLITSVVQAQQWSSQCTSCDNCTFRVKTLHAASCRHLSPTPGSRPIGVFNSLDCVVPGAALVHTDGQVAPVVQPAEVGASGALGAANRSLGAAWPCARAAASAALPLLPRWFRFEATRAALPLAEVAGRVREINGLCVKGLRHQWDPAAGGWRQLQAVTAAGGGRAGHMVNMCRRLFVNAGLPP